MNVEGYGEFTRTDLAKIAGLTKLSSPFIQQCRDRALWMWRSYHVRRKEWERQLVHAKGKWREKLLKREPRRPFHNGLRNKVPVRVDVRTGIVEASKQITLSSHVLRLSTLKRNCRVTIPLNPAEYHLRILNKGRMVDFQLVKKNGWYHAHVCVKYEVPDVPVETVRGIDLGIRRAMATVLLMPYQRLRREDLSIINDGEKRHRLNQLNRRLAELQRAKKWMPLKRMRHRRWNVAAHHDRLKAICIAEVAMWENSIVAIGYPRNIKYENYRGNEKPILRRLLQQSFSYGRKIRYIEEECVERGVRAERVLEGWTSRTCHRCGSTNTRRTSQSCIWCLNCGLEYNADWNSAMNIGSVFLPVALSRRAGEGSAHAGNELAHKPSSPESENSCGVISAR